MSKQILFLHRRGDIFSYRIAIPLELRGAIGCREFTKSLHTSNRVIAQPVALELAALTKRLFNELRTLMAENSNSESIELAKLKFEIKMRKVLRGIEANEAQIETEKQVDFAVMKVKSELFDNHLQHAIKSSLPPRVPDSPASPLLSKVIESFIQNYPRDIHLEMFKKHSTVLPLFIEIVGDKHINQLKQSDVNDFFKLIQLLPPRWADECRKKKIRVKELASIKHSVTLAPKTFISTYIASIRAFISFAVTDWQDEGFPTTLTTSKIVYRGKRVDGENKQRSFNADELQKLFNNNQMQSFINNPLEAQKFWLPYIGLYTGARVNEICQINPQTDIKQEEGSDIWYFDINETTDSDERVRKSTKNQVSRRKVPIHSALLKKGFLNYLNRIKTSKSKLLFPSFKPSRGKASGEAEKWFRQLMIDLNLRDETPGAKILGMHAFRSTFSNAAMNAGVDESSIVGHAGDASAVARGYRGELSLVKKQAIIEEIKFKL
jgi:integrase